MCSRRAGEACCAFAVADVGLFDEEFFAYFGDVDLRFRALGRPRALHR
jgi:GT2 family glycosyltransferase